MSFDSEFRSVEAISTNMPQTIFNRTVETVNETIPRKRQSMEEIIPDIIFIDQILPYLGDRKTLLRISCVSRRFREIIFNSDAAELWDKSSIDPFKLCIDGYCPTCLVKKDQGDAKYAYEFVSTCPLRRLQMHCFITDIPKCLTALSENKHLRSLDLNFTNKRNSLSLDSLLTSEFCGEFEQDSFRSLKELSIDSAHLYQVKLAGRAKLLSLLGRNLESLHFRQMSPAGVFSILQSRCPNLKLLRIDRARTSEDLISYHSNKLEELELYRCNFILPALPNVPKLRRIKFSAASRLEYSHIRTLIGNLPTSLTHLLLELPCTLGNSTLSLISKRLPNLENLALDGNFEMGKLSASALINLGRKCKELRTFSISHAKSVNALNFESVEAFTTLGREFPKLTTIRVRYEESTVVAGLDALIESSTSIRKIVLWQRKKWISAGVWYTMLEKINEFRLKYPQIEFRLQEDVKCSTVY